MACQVDRFWRLWALRLLGKLNGLETEMLLLLIPLMTILALSFYCLTAREQRWQEDKKQMQYEALRHDYYMKTGLEMKSWSRVMPAIRMKGKD